MLPLRDRTAAVARVRRAVAAALDRRQVVRPGERIVVACSGGPDSTVLLDAIARLAPPRGITLHAVHVDHGLRDGSAADADTVLALAAALSVTASSARVAVRQGDGASLQAAARAARYAALEEAAKRAGASAIVLGHTADDQAESVLMAVLSGAPPGRLAAMAERAGRRARPLLRVWRSDVDAYLADRPDLVPLHDPANRDRRFLRAAIRHDVLPLLEQVAPGVRRRLCHLADAQRAMIDGSGSAMAMRRPSRRAGAAEPGC